MQQPPSDITVYSTCPPSNRMSRGQYLDAATRIAQWSEEHGCHGMLIYTDNGLVDPWLMAQLVIQSTNKLVPLVAVQPVYMHPYTAAKQIATMAWLHDRRIDLNMLAGGFVNDLVALGDNTPHDDRYVRTTEYANILLDLLRSPKPTSYSGKYYEVDTLKMSPPLPEHLRPSTLISGSSPAGLQAARDLGATAVCYPKPAAEYQGEPPTREVPVGLRVGIIAREDGDEAWGIAHERFPVDRKGQLTHQMAMKVSDSDWHKQLSELGEQGSTYWLVPFENYRTFCPYLVGSYDEVADELAAYMRSGFSTFIMDVPAEHDDLVHCNVALQRARELMVR